MAKITRFDIENMFLTFNQKRLFLRLINSGKSNLSDKQDVLVKEAFDLAYVILKYAFDKQNHSLFNRVYEYAQELVPNKEMVLSVMKYPEMYNIMVRSKEDFYAKTKDMAETLTRYAANAGRIR